MTAASQANAGSALDVRGLCVAVAGSSVDVVTDVTFSLEPGQILGLVGESGSGKTTVGLALLGHCRRGLAIRSGSVAISGENLLAVGEGRLQEVRGKVVCYVPQDPATALNPALSIRSQLRESIAGADTLRDERLKDILDEVGLPATSRFLDAYAHQLSGGQQQRAAIAMAFSNRPRVIVLDEPTTGLDVTTQARVLETVRQLCARYGVIAVYVTHDLAVVANLASKVAVMYSGRIVEFGSASKVLGEPAHPYTRALIRAVPVLDATVSINGIRGQAPEPSDRPKGCAFAPRCGLAIDACRLSSPAKVELAADHSVQCPRSQEHAITIPPGIAGSQPSRDQPIALMIDKLNAFHGSREVLHDISIKVPERTCVALVGQSGSGKTTLARCIAGLHRQLAGSMEFEGEALAIGSRRRRPDLRRRIQYIFQNPYASLNPRRSVYRSIAAPLEEFESLPRVEINRRVAEALDSVSLTASAAARLPNQLSGGQRQRAAIARALVLEPALLICDEVTSALDVSVQAVVIQLLARLQHERGLTMIFVTHNLPLIRSIAQFAAVMHDGRMIEHGATDEVLSTPRSPQTQRLLQDVPHFAIRQIEHETTS